VFDATQPLQLKQHRYIT